MVVTCWPLMMWILIGVMFSEKKKKKNLYECKREYVPEIAVITSMTVTALINIQQSRLRKAFSMRLCLHNSN